MMTPLILDYDTDEVMETLPTSKLDDCVDELETQPGSGSSSGSGPFSESCTVDEEIDELDEEIERTLEALKDETENANECEVLQLPERPTGCPVDPCRIMVSVAYRKIRTRRTPTLPTIPEEARACVPTARVPWWKKVLNCFDPECPEEESLAIEAATGLRRSGANADLAGIGSIL
jgi:hypothetical protein